MKKDGQVTVFLSLVLVCVFALLCGILESARTAGTRYYLQTAIDSSIQSVFSQYHRTLWKKYRILGLNCAGAEAVEQEFMSFLTPYFEVKQFYPMELEGAEATTLLRLTDDGGKYVQQEILDYMKYGIWDFDLKPEEAESMFTAVKEAFGVQEMSRCWKEHTGEAMKLERALEDIMNSIEVREGLKEDASRRLRQNDGSGFRRQANTLVKELQRMPKLVKTYENRAGQLEAALEATRSDMEAKREDMGAAAWNAYEEEMAAYEDYTKADGARRLEVAALAEEVETAVLSIKDMISEAEEIEDYIDSWEPEDEDDDLDEDGLWEPLRNQFGAFKMKTLSCKKGIQDKESQGILDQVKAMAELDLMKLVMPEGVEVSKAVLPLEGCPSGTEGDGEAGLSSSLVDRIMVDEYSSKVFTNFLMPVSKEVLYEMEYLVAGENTDAGNLEAVTKQLLAVREGANLLFLLGNTAKRNEAQALAASIVGAVGLAPLVPVVTFFILSIWALGESLSDVRRLLEGGKVPLFKTERSWNLSLQGLLDMGRTRTVPGGSQQEEGFNYTGYLKLLLFATSPEKKIYRMLDLMQMNIRREEIGFFIRDCLYGVDMNADVCGKHVFLSIGLWKNADQESPAMYKIKMAASKSYGKR